MTVNTRSLATNAAWFALLWAGTYNLPTHPPPTNRPTNPLSAPQLEVLRDGGAVDPRLHMDARGMRPVHLALDRGSAALAEVGRGGVCVCSNSCARCVSKMEVPGGMVTCPGPTMKSHY